MFLGLWGLFCMALPEAGKWVRSGAEVLERGEPLLQCAGGLFLCTDNSQHQGSQAASAGVKVMVWAVQRSPSDAWVSILQTLSLRLRNAVEEMVPGLRLSVCWSHLSYTTVGNIFVLNPPPLSVCPLSPVLCLYKMPFIWFPFSKLHCHSPTRGKSHSPHPPFKVCPKC